MRPTFMSFGQTPSGGALLFESLPSSIAEIYSDPSLLRLWYRVQSCLNTLLRNPTAILIVLNRHLHRVCRDTIDVSTVPLQGRSQTRMPSRTACLQRSTPQSTNASKTSYTGTSWSQDYAGPVQNSFATRLLVKKLCHRPPGIRLRPFKHLQIAHQIIHTFRCRKAHQ